MWRLSTVPAIYHFTDVVNRPGIFGGGELRCHATAPTAVEVGDASIKDRRTRIAVPRGPGGRVCDYVPFYFAPRSPMLFSIQAGNVPNVSSDQRRLAYFVSSTEAAYAAKLACVFTNGNAATAFTTFDDDPARLGDLVDWPVMELVFWHNTPDDPDRRRRRMAEFLVHRAVPLRLVTEIAVYDDRVAAYVAGLLGAAPIRPPVAIRRDWYL
jgi:hypothetical protein